MGLIPGLLGVLGRIPAIAWLVIAIAGWGAWNGHRAQSARDTLRDAEQTAATARANAKTQALARHAQVGADHREIISAAERATSLQRDAADRARAERDRVLRDFRRARDAASTVAAAAAATAGPPASAPADLSADLLGRCSQRVLDLAAYADSASTAGAACERAYNALIR